MRCRLALPVLLFVLLVPSAASAAANKEHLQLMAEIRMLQEQQQQLQGLLGALQDTLKTVTTKLDDQSAAMRKAMADQTLAVNNIGDNVRVLREKTDETNVRISTMSQDLEALRQTIASQPAPQMVAPPPTATDPTSAAGAGAAAPAPQAPPPGVSAQRMYEASYDDYTSARYDMAIRGFEGFIQAFPKVQPQAAKAQYNIGMSYYSQSKWPEAREAFDKVVSDHAQQTDEVADAYYKLGQTYEQLKQVDNAKKAYETVVQKYSTTRAFTLANQALQRLNRR